MVKSYKNSWLGHRFLLSLLAVIVVVAGVALVINHDKNSPNVTTPPRPTITQLPEHKASNNGEKKPSTTSQVNQGTATDNNGAGQVNTPSNQWTISASGAITVKDPAPGSTVKSGFLLAGSATVGKIQYRLIDDQVGVISQGFISVVNGNFSASVNFPSYGKSGRLDVFSTSSNGAEINEVQIQINLGG